MTVTNTLSLELVTYRHNWCFVLHAEGLGSTEKLSLMYPVEQRPQLLPFTTYQCQSVSCYRQ